MRNCFLPIDRQNFKTVVLSEVFSTFFLVPLGTAFLPFLFVARAADKATFPPPPRVFLPRD